MAQGKDIQEDVEALLKQKEQAEQELSKIKSEKKAEELKNTAAMTATTALKGINSLLSSNKISKLEKENERLQGVISKRDDQIKELQSDAERFPLVGEYLRVERECLMHGFSEEQTDKLVHGQALKFRGYLQADKRSPRVWAENVTAQIIRMAKDRLQLTIEQSPIVQWIQQQLENNKKEKLVKEQNISNHHGFHI